MKPLNIHLKNIGPFRDESVDFTQLDDMFLLCGDTGAGKTTIFDALSYALYGQLLGSRKGNAKDFRSNLAKESEDSLVEFEFEVNGDRYRVTRTLPRSYVTRNNTTRTTDTTVELEEWNPATKSYKSTNLKKTETDERLVKIIGLEYKEFSRIVVLPQGDFDVFLKSNSSEKHDMLLKLFPIGTYSEIVEKAKEKYGSISKELERVEADLKKMSADTAITNFDERIADLDMLIEENKAKQDSIQKDREMLSSEKALLETKLKDAKERDASKSKLHELESKSSEIEATKDIIALAKSAAGLGPYIKNKKTRESEKNTAVRNLQDSESQHSTALLDLENLEGQKEEFASREKSVTENKIKFENQKRQLGVIGNLEESEQTLSSELKKKGKIESELNEMAEKLNDMNSTIQQLGADSDCENTEDIITSLLMKKSECEKNVQAKEAQKENAKKLEELKSEEEKLKASISSLEAEKKEHEDQKETLEKLLEDSMRQKEEQEKNNHAVLLVSKLKPGCPCPVCGSTEHPSPAVKISESVDVEKKIETLKKSVADCESKINSVSTKIASERAHLEDRSKEIEQLSSIIKVPFAQAQQELQEANTALEELSQRLSQAQRLDAQIKSIQNQIDSTKGQLSECEKIVSAKTAESETYKKQLSDLGGSQFNRQQLESDTRALESSIAEDEKACRNFSTKLVDAQKHEASALAALSSCREISDTAAAKFDEAEKELLSRISETKFATPEEAEKSYKTEAEIERLERTVESFHKEIDSLKTQIELLSKKCGDKADEIHSMLEEKNRLLDEKKKTAAELGTQNDKLIGELKELKTNKGKFADLMKQEKELSEKLEPYEQLFKDLSGSNPKKTPFETWFLGVYFSDVIKNANRHLLKISSERYEFNLNLDRTSGNGYKGLDLLVHDYQCNSDRDTATLSGGETFMASISLALGLTEVVSKGVRLDSLFIDEGFGSLDKESLELAISILQEVGDSRKVGVISHVEEMQGTITSQVNVEKTRSGSHITIRN